MGAGNYSLPTNEQTELGHWLIDQGVDLDVDHHPHCIQPIERYHDHYIVYSLGNCIFPSFNVDSHFDSHFDERGVPHRKYRFSWRKWNNIGLALVFDTDNNISHLDELKSCGNTLRCTKRNMPIQKYLKMFHGNRYLAKIQYRFRKYWLFVVSNAFVDGKIFDCNALKAELNK